ncbi:MAG: helix-turn-helix domain-containing protein [Actinomycetota bacterium]|nr:helix-turn-helix domain-containing protein [Actinomycetota bacterium]
MTHPTFLREKARTLRIAQGLTIDELAERLALSRSTIYCWVRDLPVPRSVSGVERSEAARRKGNRSMCAKYRRLREAAYEEGRRTFESLATGDPTFRDFVCLYIAEGHKRDRNRVSLANSDPRVIKVANRWIKRFAKHPVHYALQYHADQDLDGLTGFCAHELEIEPTAIRLQRKSNSNQLSGRVWRSRHGVLTVGANDTALRARLEGWMHCLRDAWT